MARSDPGIFISYAGNSAESRRYAFESRHLP